MSTIVNVEGLKFENLIPQLLDNDLVKDEVRDHGTIKTLRFLQKKFSLLKRGKSFSGCILAMSIVQCLDTMHRVLMHADCEHCETYEVTPIRKKRLKDFLKNISEAK